MNEEVISKVLVCVVSVLVFIAVLKRSAASIEADRQRRRPGPVPRPQPNTTTFEITTGLSLPPEAFFYPVERPKRPATSCLGCGASGSADPCDYCGRPRVDGAAIAAGDQSNTARRPLSPSESESFDAARERFVQAWVERPIFRGERGGW